MKGEVELGSRSSARRGKLAGVPDVLVPAGRADAFR